MDPNTPNQSTFATPPAPNPNPQHPTAPGFENPQRSTRPDGTSAASVSAPVPSAPASQDSNEDAARRKEQALSNPAEREAALARQAAGGEPFDPNGRVIHRPDVAYLDSTRAAEEDRRKLGEPLAPLNPLRPGTTIFSFNPRDGASLTLDVMRDGSLAVKIAPDKGLPVSVRVAGEDADKLRRALL